MTGWRLETYAELPSTSDLLLARAEAGEPEGLAVLALRQTAGRGRASRPWVSPPGNLYLSVLLRPAEPARTAPQWSLLAGLALVEAAAEIAPSPGALQLKWPNDLLLEGAKCAGILAESTLAPDGRLAWLVLGFGVNLAAPPPLPDRPTAALGAPEPPAAFAGRLLRRLDHWYARQRAEGFGPIRTGWLGHGPALGSAIAVRRGADHMHGSFAGLADDGSLRLQQDDGAILRVATGEVLGMG